MPIDEAWKAFLSARDEDIAEELAKNPEYRQLRNKSRELSNSIEAKLSPEGRKELLMLDEVETALTGLCEDIYYMTGFRDSIQLATKIIRLGGDGEEINLPAERCGLGNFK